MKKFLLVTFMSVLFLAGCNSGNNKKASEEVSEKSVEKSGKSEDFDKAKDCDEFIAQYEKWMDDYLKMMEKYIKNPMDQTLSEEYLKVSQEALTWMEQWTNLAVCASKDKYQKKFDAISERAEKKMKELGFE